MQEVFNNKKLRDDGINQTQKFKSTIYVKKGTYAKAESLISLTNSQSRNDVIEKAIDWYYGFISGDISQDYLCGVFGSKVEGVVGNMSNRIARLEFKNAVEMNMLARMLATQFELSKDGYERMRKKSVDEVKRTNGTIDILSASLNDGND